MNFQKAKASVGMLCLHFLSDLQTKHCHLTPFYPNDVYIFPFTFASRSSDFIQELFHILRSTFTPTVGIPEMMFISKLNHFLWFSLSVRSHAITTARKLLITSMPPETPDLHYTAFPTAENIWTRIFACGFPHVPRAPGMFFEIGIENSKHLTFISTSASSKNCSLCERTHRIGTTDVEQLDST